MTYDDSAWPTGNTDPNAFLMGGGSKSAKFENIGDKVTGTVLSLEAAQQTDIATQKPLTWDDGRPKMQVIVTLATTLREDDDDDGTRRVYVKGKSLTAAVRDAVRAVRAKGLETGGTLTVTFTGEGEASQRGFNKPKLYAATYAAPLNVAANDALGITEPAPSAFVPPPAAGADPLTGWDTVAKTAPAAAAAPAAPAVGKPAQAKELLAAGIPAADVAEAVGLPLNIVTALANTL